MVASEWFGEEGPFAGALSAWSALGLIVVAALVATPPVALRSAEVPVVPWTRVAVHAPKAVTVPAPPAASPTRESDAPRATKAPAAAPPPRGRDGVKGSKLLQKLLGTRGDGRDDVRARVFGDEAGPPDFSAAAATTAAAEEGPRRRGGVQGPADGEDIGLVGGGGVELGRVAVLAQAPSVESATGDVAALSRSPRIQSALRWCYEQELKVHPTLQGRLELRWDVQDGRVSGPVVTADTVGSDGLAACVARRARFDAEPGVSGRLTLPVVFSRK